MNNRKPLGILQLGHGYESSMLDAGFRSRFQQAQDLKGLGEQVSLQGAAYSLG